MGHNFPEGVQIAQYVLSGDEDKVGDCVDGTSAGGADVGAWLGAVTSTSLALMVASQFLCLALGRDPTFTFLGLRELLSVGNVKGY